MRFESSFFGPSFNVENLLDLFVTKWLDGLAKHSYEWVDSAIKNDKFESMGDSETHYSSSVMDLFTVIYQELDFIIDLKWIDQKQRCKFYQKFLKVVLV